MRTVIKDKRFIDKYHALVEKGDTQRGEKAINAKHDEILSRTDLVARVMRGYGVFSKKKAAAAPGDKGNKGAAGDKGNANAGAGWIKVSKRPQNSQINWTKTTQAMQLDGKYVLLDGKKVIVQY